MQNKGSGSIFKLEKIEPLPLFKPSLLLLIVLFFSLMTITGYAEEIALSFNETVAIGLRDNRDILLKIQDVQKAKLEIAEAQAGVFPTLTFTGDWFYTIGHYSKQISQTSSQISLKQYLYQGGKVINSMKYSRYGWEVEQSLLNKVKLETIFLLSKAYYTLLLAGSFVRLNETILENSREHLDYINSRYNNGQASQTDILQAQASLANVEQAFDSSRAQAEAARALLNNLLALDKDVLIIPSCEFKFIPKDIAFEQGFLKAMQTRPEIKQFESQLKADKSAIEVARAEGRPNIYVSWDYYSRSHAVTTTVNTRNWNDYNVAGVTFSWPIFDGWLTKAKAQEAMVDLKQTQLGQVKLVGDIALEVKNAYLSLKNSIERIKAAGVDILFYKNNLLTADEKYAQGQVSALDNHDARLKYAITVFNQEQAVYDYYIAKFSFDKVTGGFNEL
ncbi:MAG: TolC family protein [Candidatus Omnitrophota bacterium]